LPLEIPLIFQQKWMTRVRNVTFSGKTLETTYQEGSVGLT